jgi:antitoxin component YwqK of YwqJK toxin-antitoxin module
MQLEIAEIPFESGAIKHRYSRYMNEDQTRWIRHGLFTAFHENGAKASEFQYVHGVEQGECIDFHSNGQVAAKGQYHEGKEQGLWRYWAEDGSEEPSCFFEDGIEQDAL